MDMATGTTNPLPGIGPFGDGTGLLAVRRSRSHIPGDANVYESPDGQARETRSRPLHNPLSILVEPTDSRRKGGGRGINRRSPISASREGHVKIREFFDARLLTSMQEKSVSMTLVAGDDAEVKRNGPSRQRRGFLKARRSSTARSGPFVVSAMRSGNKRPEFHSF